MSSYSCNIHCLNCYSVASCLLLVDSGLGHFLDSMIDTIEEGGCTVHFLEFCLRLSFYARQHSRQDRCSGMYLLQCGLRRFHRTLSRV